VVGAVLSTAGAGADALDNRLLAVAPKVAEALDPTRRPDDRAVALFELRIQASEWLQVDRPPLETDRQCFHWPLEFPEIFQELGFTALCGNPPFVADANISSLLGRAYREWMVGEIAKSRRGRSDLVGFFLLRAAQVCSTGATVGLIATNTVAQGDTREVGLDYLVQNEWALYRAIKSQPWPGEATLQVSQIWLYRGAWFSLATLDGSSVTRITSSLDLEGRVAGPAFRLGQDGKRSFQGSFVGGAGFVLEDDEARALLAKDPINRDVVLPFLNGEDLNSRPDCSPSRWVINFFDWPIERAEGYPDCIQILYSRVKPYRDQVNRAAHRKYWWQYGDKRPALYSAIRPLSRVIAIALTSKSVAPAFVPKGIVFSHALGIFAYDDYAHFGLLSSAIHYWWAVTRASTMRTDIRYTPTDCFETFPQPTLTEAVGKAGGELDTHRRALMVERWEGLTKTYNRVHDPDERAEDIVELRRLNVELDHAVAVAYGWDDLPIDHAFHDTRQGVRYTLGPTTRTELLDRLLELNHERAAAEAAAGLTRQRRSGARRRPVDGQTSLEAL
jgi:hypothetical protein